MSISLHAGRATLRGTVEAFLLSRQVLGCTRATLASYRELLGRFLRTVGDDWSAAAPLVVHRYLVELQSHCSGMRA